MRNDALLILTCCAAMCSSVCATRVPQPKGGPPGKPQVSWVVMAGDRDNPDAQFVCQSDPRSACVLAASRPNAQVWSSVYFYYHGVGADVKYTGSIKVGFFEGPPTESHEIRPDIVVKPHEHIARQSVVDDVASKPGTYAMTVDVLATTGSGNTPIHDSVSVVVR